MKFKKAIIGVMTAAVLASSVLFGACVKDETPPDGPSVGIPVKETPTRTVEETKLTVYEGPGLIESSKKLNAYVEDEELFVYETRVNHKRIFGWAAPTTYNQVVNFDFEGKVHIKVEVNQTNALINKKDTVVDVVSVSDVVVRPLSYGVEPTVNGNVIEFDLEYSSNYTVEYKANYDNDGVITADVEDPADNALHIFANPIETNPITEEQAKADPDIIYVGPGVYLAGAIPMTSNQTLYLAGGAFVYGNIRTSGLENITIRGRGIISGEIYTRTGDADYTLPIEMQKCKNITIEGITILDPAGWAVTLYMCENVKVDNLKVITARPNGDGISVQSSHNVNVKGGFIRTWDDSLVVKNTDRGTTSDITFDGVTVWTDLAQSCEVGFETYGETMNNITFKNITIVHNYHKAAMSIHNCDDAVITNVLYQSITVEDAQMLGDNRIDGLDDFLIDIKIAYSPEWTKSGGDRGTVSGVVFDNIKVLSMLDTIICRIDGESKKSAVSNVVISGVEIAGEAKTTKEAIKLAEGTYTGNITVKGAEGYEIFGSGAALPYNLDLKAGDKAQPVVKPNKQQGGLEVPDFAILDIEESYMGVQMNLPAAAEISAQHGAGTTATTMPDYSVSFDPDNTLSNAFDGDRSTAFVAGDWTGEANEYISITIDFKEYKAPGVLRLYFDENNTFVRDLKISVFTKYSASTDSEGNPFVNSSGKVVDEVALDEKGNPKFTDKNGVITWTAANFVRTVSSGTYTSTPATGNYFDIKLPTTLKCNQMQIRFFRTEGITAMDKLSVNEIVFYPCSLSTNASILDSSKHEDVYPNTNIVDGNNNTYFEVDKTIWKNDPTQPVFVTVDMGRAYDVKYFVMHVPQPLTWETRTQEIEIQVSEDNITYTTVCDKTAFTFNPKTGNVNTVKLDSSVRARYVKIIFYSNTAGYGAQLSELYVYGE